MSNDLYKDREWLKRLVATMDEISSQSSGASALDSQIHSLHQRLKLPASAGASGIPRFAAPTWTPCRAVAQRRRAKTYQIVS
jgi:hypothetical protein